MEPGGPSGAPKPWSWRPWNLPAKADRWSQRSPKTTPARSPQNDCSKCCYPSRSRGPGAGARGGGRRAVLLCAVSAGWCLRTPPPRSVDLGGAPVSRRVGRCCLRTHLPLSPSGIGRVTQSGSVGCCPTNPECPNLSHHRSLMTHDRVSGEKGGWDRPPRVLHVAQRGGIPQATTPPGCGAQRGATVLQAVPRSKTQEPQMQYQPPGRQGDSHRPWSMTRRVSPVTAVGARLCTLVLQRAGGRLRPKVAAPAVPRESSPNW